MHLSRGSKNILENYFKCATFRAMRQTKNEEPIRIFFLLAIVFILYNFTLLPLGVFKIPALHTDDFFTNLAIGRKALPEAIKDIVIVAVDTHSLKKAGLQWPWKRSIFAHLVKRIHEGKPKAIFLDFIFAGKSGDEAADVLFAEEIKKANNVILAGYIEEDEFIKPQELFVSSARGVGFVNKKSETQDVMSARKAQIVFSPKNTEEKFDYSIEAKILALAKGYPLSDIRYDGGRVMFSPELSFPVDAYGALPINYSVPTNSFTSIPVYKIISSEPLEPSLFRDKIVLVGMTANISQDIHMTPVGRLPGIYINAHTLLMFLSGELIRTFPYWHNKILIFLFTFAIGFLSLRLKDIYSALVLAGFIGIASAAYLFLQIRFHFTMDIFSLLFLPTVAFGAVEIYKYANLIIEAQKLKRWAIVDAVTGFYTQRYFQINVVHALQKPAKKAAHFFCLVRINEFAQLKEKYPASLAHLIKMLSETIKAHMGRKLLIARYGEETLSLCVWNVKRKWVERSLALLIAEIANREFIMDKEVLKISVTIAALDFPRDNLKGYEDLVLTCESVLKRITPDEKVPVAIFDPKVDRVIRASAIGQAGAMPKGELAYVSMDMVMRNKELEAAIEELKQQQKKIEQYYFFTMHSLVKALEEKDPYTAGHSERVGFYATELAKSMNLSQDEVKAVNRAAYLHDIGKIGLPDKILHKKERLTDDEFEFIKRHQAAGAKILQGIPFYEQVVPYILYHHERYDGKGYPHGLSGEMIPIGAQIIAIADAFDAMTTGRGYNKPLGAVMDEAIAELKKCSGTQFNPAYVHTFIELLEQKKIHTLSNAPVPIRT